VDLTWLAIIASLCMGAGAALVFVYAVKKNYFRNIEDTKYQVFWPEVEQLLDSAEHEEEGKENGESTAEAGR